MVGNQARSENDLGQAKFVMKSNGKENHIPFNRSNDISSAQWVSILHPQDLPKRTKDFSSRLKLQKCEKCSHEFCSTINYRRHVRSHRKNLNVDKDSREKIWAELKAFWDKLSADEVMEVVSLKDISLEGLSGSMILSALTSLSGGPGLVPLPQDYQGAAFKLLNIVQAKSSSFPISSEELFSILDEASEYTFLRAGTPESLLKYVIDGDARKIALYSTNLIACTSFLVELKLVKACLDHKESDAMKMQKMLMEEEEAKQRKQAARSEKSRLKKLRQKEQRAMKQMRMEIVNPPGDDTPSAPTSRIADEPACIPESAEIADTSSQPFNIVKEKGGTCEDYVNKHPEVEDVSCEAGEPDCTLESAELTDNSPPSQEPALVVYEEVDVSIDHARGYPELEDGRVAFEPDCNPYLEEYVEDGSRVYVILVGSLPMTVKADQQLSDIRGGASEVCALKPTTSGQSGLADPSTAKQLPPVGRHASGSQLPGQNSPSSLGVDLDDEALQTSLAGNDPQVLEEISYSPVDILKGGAAIERAWQFLRQRAKEAKDALHAGDPDVKKYKPEGSHLADSSIRRTNPDVKLNKPEGSHLADSSVRRTKSL